MALRPILIIPEPRLRQLCAPVTGIDAETRKLVSDMFETMYDAPGIGLAAPQVGVLRRVVTIDLSREDEPRQPLAMINPEIIAASEERSIYSEGCLSIPDYYEEVERPAEVTVRYMTLEGKTVEQHVSGLLSTCVQHEIDHLNGVLFIDYLSKLKRDRVNKKFAKAARREDVG
ncbi:MAG: peptide deformylase [Azorhizobium sp. 32-67-21]|nr:MAG: peptide deformylase [Rhizobiales bacterium 12-68-15]OYX84330.1 MAG: peptide deformylase [Azorhizobium sp. 32-67-21]OYY07915.1 MAG: peptide deformylase [Rhizobiales bacterium 35-68-8]